MALIKCRECDGQVSDKAASCPHCGAPLNPAPAPPPPAAVTEKKKPASYGCGTLIFILIVVGIIAATCSNDSPSSSGSAATPAKAACSPTELQCNGEAAIIGAGIYCRDAIERQAKHSVKWIDGTFEQKFSRFKWLDQKAGTLKLFGDKVEFQNGFGAFTRMIYSCDYNPKTNAVLDVTVAEGRLPN